jgi:ABC-type Fe3+ transport system substrate-binding protein
MKHRRCRLFLCGLVAAWATVASSAALADEDWQAGAPPEWTKILADAKKEGHVAVVGPSELAVPMAEGFLKDTGIQVDFLGGVAAVNQSRVAREVRSGNVTVDFMFTGTAELPLVKEGFFADEKAKLLLPGTVDPKYWKDNKITWVDNTQKYMLRTQATVQSIPFFDPETVKPPLTSWKQLLQPEFTGKIVAYDPRAGGPGQQMVGYIGATFGMDFLKALYIGQKAVFSQDSRQMAEWIVRGVYSVGLGVLLPDYVNLHNAGITNLVPAEMTDGHGTLSGGFSVLIIPKNAPHPNAQIVFLNWVAGQRGQSIYSHVEHQLSRRVDVHEPTVLPFTVPKSGVDYLDQYTEDWALNQRKKIIDEVLEALGGR